VHVKPIHWNIKTIVHDYKDRAQKRRENDIVRTNGKIVAAARVKVTEVLAKNEHSEYTCPNVERHLDLKESQIT
jgi:hypothetical protein